MTPEQIEIERRAFHSRIPANANLQADTLQFMFTAYLWRAEQAQRDLEAVVADAEQDESGWLIEFNADGNALWWDGTFKPIGDHWDERRNRLGANMVNRVNDAVRFANRESAQKVLDGLLAMRPFSVLANAAELYSVTEHLWPAPAAAIDTARRADAKGGV
jgi:hypothetical protein